MNMRDKEFTSRTGGGPGGAADAGERNFAPGRCRRTPSPRPARRRGHRAPTKAPAPTWPEPRPMSTTSPR